MPVEFVTEVEARQWGRFAGEPTSDQLERFFYLDPDDLARVSARRSDCTRLGYGVQLGTLRFLGTFLAQVDETPAAVVSHVADQLAIPATAWAAYPASRARLVHAGEIRRAYGYVAYGDGLTHRRFLRWMFDRAWTADDPSSKLLDAATGWLVDHKVVLPGVTTITRLVAQVRDRANQRACRRLTGPLQPDRQRRLLSLLDVDAETGVSALERLRRPPRNPTIDGLVGALARLAEIKTLGGDRIDTARLPEGRHHRTTDHHRATLRRLHRRRLADNPPDNGRQPPRVTATGNR